ncbi:MAG: ribosome small subunit-dependent GTPase A [Bacilli bacterium]|nr:ribosome small subunit-dependent GTPase A [Bacilli bacterium]
MVKGMIVKQISNDYTVFALGEMFVCKARGKFRNMDITPLVGDFVNFDKDTNYILEVLPRKNELVRPSIANIDQAVIITSLKEPNFDSNLLDKLLCIIEFNNVKPIVIFTKADLLSELELEKFKEYYNYYKSIGIDVYFNDDLEQISKIFKDKVSVFTGQSGAGKSTLLNRLDDSLNIKTGEISLALNRGKHTTRHTSLLKVYGGLVADTPGFSALNFGEMSKGDIRDNFIEFNTYRDKCKYRDCMHDKEDDCEVKDRVKSGDILISRYDNYINFISKG